MTKTMEKTQFIMEDYDEKPPFSSFLPGIAGKKGVPLWAFYANRGQGITSFGIGDKDTPIMEFFPANTSYQYVDRYGFRSFVRVDEELYEPFSITTEDRVKRTMGIGRGHFFLEETNETRGIVYRVTYYGLAQEPLAGLVRKVKVQNIGKQRDIEVVDGMANLLPCGATTEGYKSMSNLMVSWMHVENLENHLPFFRFRASSGDSSQVSVSTKGHFYLSFVKDHELIRPIVDPEVVFGQDTSLSIPLKFKKHGIQGIASSLEGGVNKVPCALTPYGTRLGSKESFEINTIIGHAASLQVIEGKVDTYSRGDFINQKFQEAEGVIDELVEAVESNTAFPDFDQYMKQTFLDNTLRGGYPLVYGKGKEEKIYHIYSRKHGDPERDYNFFKLAPEFYSQGNGNFRDVNQNRRNDVFLVPQAGLFNVKMFMNLIQLDGYNPLVVQGTTFTLEREKAQRFVGDYVKEKKAVMEDILLKPFTPGKLSMEIALQEIPLAIAEESFLKKVLESSEQHIEAIFGEGFWTDHWTYNLDLIESYLSIYPDRLKDLLHEDRSFCYYESPAWVRPRKEKTLMKEGGSPRQYGALEEEPHSLRFERSNWVRTTSGKRYYTNLAQKLMTLVLTKLSSLDPSGIGIEMEGEKPGWNDAMNGLPGLFGSGVGETLELMRVLRFLGKHVIKDVDLCEENHRFYCDLKEALDQEESSLGRWESFATAREAFRSGIRQGIQGKEVTVEKEELLSFIKKAEVLVEEGIQRGKDMNRGILPTYLIHIPENFKPLGTTTPYGLPGVEVTSFRAQVLPTFLEGPARGFAVGGLEENQRQYQYIRESQVYDHELKMYKTSGPLDDLSYEAGRIRAFTPGWLERESNFLHMTYKYLLGLLKGGLYEEFYQEIKTNLVCFMDPEVYGRSPMENSSFIATSRNPDPKVRGRGFYARLSGSTAETLSMWRWMFFGERLFTYEGELRFTPKPLIHKSFFLRGRVKTMLFSRIEYIIENSTGHSTYSKEVAIDHYLVDGIRREEITGALAEAIRNCEVKKIVLVYQRKGV